MVTPVNPKIDKGSSSLEGIRVFFFLNKRIRTIIGVAMKNLRNPKLIGEISLYVNRTATKDPAHARLTRISNTEVVTFFLSIFHRNII